MALPPNVEQFGENVRFPDGALPVGHQAVRLSLELDGLALTDNLLLLESRLRIASVVVGEKIFPVWLDEVPVAESTNWFRGWDDGGNVKQLCDGNVNVDLDAVASEENELNNWLWVVVGNAKLLAPNVSDRFVVAVALELHAPSDSVVFVPPKLNNGLANAVLDVVFSDVNGKTELLALEQLGNENWFGTVGE